VIGLDTNVLARYFVAEQHADALHHASCRGCEAMASFDDRGFVRRARQLNLAPRVFVPTGS